MSLLRTTLVSLSLTVVALDSACNAQDAGTSSSRSPVAKSSAEHLSLSQAPQSLRAAYIAARQTAGSGPSGRALSTGSLAYFEDQQVGPETNGDGAQDDAFGSSVALVGNVALIGVPLDDVGGNIDQGSVYVFVRNGTTWSQQTKLTAIDGAAGDKFGFSVALSGDTALVGAPYGDVSSNSDQGAAYVFVRSGTTWSQQAKLTATDGAAIDQFGFSVALSGDTALIGANLADGANQNQGAAYVIVRSGTAWSQQTKLTVTNGGFGDQFGASVALSGETALVGAPNGDVATNGNEGTAYVFIREGGTIWSLQQTLTADSPASNDKFGASVALDTDTALVGAPSDDVGSNPDQGSVYVFVRSGATWIRQSTLTASDPAASAQFGNSVSLSGDTALVGEAHNTAPGGSAYVFVRSTGGWSESKKLIADDGKAGDLFGSAVAISDTTALIGAPQAKVGIYQAQGSAYFFVLGTDWSEQAEVIVGDGASDDQLGISVALSGDIAVVGAPYDDVGANVDQGSAYVFVRSGDTWSQEARLTAADGAAHDGFGVSVALSGQTALIGA